MNTTLLLQITMNYHTAPAYHRWGHEQMTKCLFTSQQEYDRFREDPESHNEVENLIRNSADNILSMYPDGANFTLIRVDKLDSNTNEVLDGVVWDHNLL